MTPRYLFFDTETTGTGNDHCIWQIAGRIYDLEKREVLKEFNFKMCPARTDNVSPKALEVGGITLEEMKTYPPQREVFKKFMAMLDGTVDKFNKKDKLFMAAYNAKFDERMLRNWFAQNGERYFGSYFFNGAVDVMALAANHLRNQRHEMENFKLETVALHLGVADASTEWHDAAYDIEATFQVWAKIDSDG
jgi:DNA polymerase-3 subunit epsilon